MACRGRAARPARYTVIAKYKMEFDFKHDNALDAAVFDRRAGAAGRQSAANLERWRLMSC